MLIKVILSTNFLCFSAFLKKYELTQNMVVSNIMTILYIYIFYVNNIKIIFDIIDHNFVYFFCRNLGNNSFNGMLYIDQIANLKRKVNFNLN
jgi:hypothetical protein